MRRLGLPFACALLAVACASSSGVDGKLVINALPAADWQRYCTWYNAEVAGIIGKSCPGGALINNPQISDCAAKNPAGTCSATVAQVEDCVRRYRDQACEGISKVAATCNNFGPNCYGLLAGSNL